MCMKNEKPCTNPPRYGYQIMHRDILPGTYRALFDLENMEELYATGPWYLAELYPHDHWRVPSGAGFHVFASKRSALTYRHYIANRNSFRDCVVVRVEMDTLGTITKGMAVFYLWGEETHAYTAYRAQRRRIIEEVTE